MAVKMEMEETSLSSNSSTSVNSINISFSDITHTVPVGFLGKRKVILKGLHGKFDAGQLTVILGQSGAGKSTLMDIVSSYTKPTGGVIRVNGEVRDDQVFQHQSCYIMQDTDLHPALTARETVSMAAQLKLGSHFSAQDKEARVEKVLKDTGLAEVGDTMAMHLSGGQKKRLSVAVELVSDPLVLLLDEPISGLDCLASERMVTLLQQLAREGRTVVATIHQPSARLLEMFDRIYAVHEGQCAYFGAVGNLVPFLKSVDLECPRHHNPVDFLLEILPQNADELVKQTENGGNRQWFNNTRTGADPDEINVEHPQILKKNPTRRLLMNLKSTYATSCLRQVDILTKRALLSLWRNPSSTLSFLCIHVGMAIFISYLFYGVGEDAKYLRENINFLFYNLMFIMFTAFSAVVIYFPQELPIVRREHFNHWYSSGAFYVATVLSSLPLQSTCVLLYAIITYYESGQPLEFWRLGGFCLVLLLVSYVALTIGLLVGSMCSVKNGVIFGPFAIMPFTVFSGFFLRYSDAPKHFVWIFQMSFMKHGLVGMVLTIFGMDRPTMYCSSDMCFIKQPKQIIKEHGFEREKFSLAIVALLGTAAVAIAISALVLNIRLRKKW